MSIKSRARALQRLTGGKYLACRTEILRRGPLIGALRRLDPNLTMQQADAAICFESEQDLLSRYGKQLFELACITISTETLSARNKDNDY